MATNFIATGDKLTLPAPFAVTRGNIVVVNTNLFGVAQDNAASASNVVLATTGIFSFTKTSGASTSAAAGGYVYWDNTNSKATISATSNTKIGVCVETNTNNDTTVKVRLNPSF